MPPRQQRSWSTHDSSRPWRSDRDVRVTLLGPVTFTEVCAPRIDEVTFSVVFVAP
ncbi:hypothetical protein BKA24_000861 [Microbacterium marinum]|uniref:Uncharacterized protein n=1 Tax=Microbacterium marinum TaxID=421115 RepID=A0A7W7BNY1_9MICO|nr:hypothetical protein [Microbacterium marinum]MBB4666152.1 hypothetical protein [Microbacterium marinum]